jgi:leucyl/phenylalanyl-tRNA--protein transferase
MKVVGSTVCCFDEGGEELFSNSLLLIREGRKNVMTRRADIPVLDPEFILNAYCNAYFPMADSRTGAISWYSPDPRAIIPLDALRVPRTLRQVLRKKMFEVRVDTAFEEIIRGCADREDTWISEEIVVAYNELHRRGYAHSVESWHANELAGGLYGVAIGAAFFGESMFSRMSGASKVALVHLVERLRSRGFRLLDSQFMNEHIRQFGAVEIPRGMYLKKLTSAISSDTRFL